ncbi:MAG TPA: LysR family transcriptional regulator [Vicinamibacteria bacterium]|nr:LysR family transcriptional regulator [Vicinamibacteria bacterium]
MDVRQLDMFRAVAEEGSFTRAAERLHVSQSAISRQIKLLEEELGGVLLHRGGKRVALTPPGELLLKTANRVHRDLQEVASQISDTHALHRGTLSLAGGMTVCMHILPRVLRKYLRLYKEVDLRVVSAATETILRLIRNHEVDLALLTLPIVAKDLEVVPVLKEEMVVVTARGHPLSRERTIETSRLGRYPWILYEAGSNTRKILEQFFREEEIQVDVAMETENVEIIKSMVAAGLGITLIPYAAIVKDVRHGRFSYARVRGRRLYRETAWVYLRSDYVPRSITEMMRVFDLMKDQFGSKPPGA